MQLKNLFLLVMSVAVLLGTAYSQQIQAAGKDIGGTWLGRLDVGGMKIRLVFKITQGADGQWTAIAQSPDQSKEDIPCSRVSWEKDQVIIEIKMLQAEFTGRISPDFNELAGTFKQAGASLPLSCKRKQAGDKELTFATRPQDPVKPYPYLEEEVSFPNPKAHFNLAGTLTLPEKTAPKAAVILITGSGSQDRNEELLNHRPFLVLADYLTRRGIAVLRLDDRGVGQSGGKELVKTSTTLDFVDDIAAAVDYLETRKEIPSHNIGLIGHSEGGCIAPMLAARDKRIAFIVMMAGLGTTGVDCLVAQNAKGMELEGVSASDVQVYRQLTQEIFKVLNGETDHEKIRHKILALNVVYKKKMSEKAGEMLDKELKDSPLDKQIEIMTSPWFRFFLTFDPAGYLKKVTCPVLAINGGKDCQVIARDNLPLIEKYLKAAHNKHVTIKELPDLNHLFQTCKTGTVAEYAQIDETMSPVALDLMAKWIEEQVKK